ncbi:MAG: hypothetical protein IPP93_12190 [Chitinophagaceae bacterium]|nr:hypothetical protein [Chitinophagaceae bacterium]
MNRFLKSLLSIVCFTATGAFGQNEPANKALAHTIDSLYNAEQACAQIKQTDSASAAYKRITHSNFPVVQQILDKYGFPGYDVVGKEVSDNYFVLVQHSDSNVVFQKKALKLMKIQVDRKNATGSNYGYLVDRINLNTGKKQIYGTQVQMGENGTKLKPCTDTLNLDKRRKSIGLIPIKDYLEQCDEVFRQLNPDKVKKEN